MIEGVEDLVNSQFCFTILKKRFTYLIYKHLKKHNWKYLMLLFEDSDNPYKNVVAIMFYDEHGYFRKLEVPMPILQRDAEKAQSGRANDDPLLPIAAEILDEAKTAKRVPRGLWAKIPAKDIYDMLMS